MASLLAIRLPAPAGGEAIRAAWDAGQAVLPLDARAPDHEVARALEALRPAHLLDEQGRRPVEGGEEVDPEVAAVVATSGTSGPPRGVELTWDGLRASALAVSAALDGDGHDTWLCCLPLHHVAGLAVLARSWAGPTQLRVARFDPVGLGHAEATLVSLVPAMLRRALDAGADLSRFRRVLVGGAAVPDELSGRAVAAGVRMVATYGLTETWGGCVHDGIPLSGVGVRLGADDEIRLRGPMLMRGYRLRPDDTAAAFDSAGWLRTGDAGALSADGRLRVVDRLTDMVITGGVNVSPTEVETVLSRHPAVADVCVTGAPDPEWGERVVAHVVPAEGAGPPTLASLRSFARDHLSAAKLPRQVVVVEAIPRTAGGKPLRRLLPRP